MNDTQTRVLRLPDSNAWPPLRQSPAQVRALARRRGTRRGLLVAAAVAVAVPTAMQAWPSAPNVSEAAGQPELVAGRWQAFGVSVSLPPGWAMQPGPARAGRNQACLGPQGEEAGCPLLLAVTTDPDSAPAAGFDLASDLTAGCAGTDPRFVTVERTTVRGRSATHWLARCVATSQAVSAWGLDNRTVALYVQDPAATASAINVFATLEVPADWPTDGLDWATATMTTSPAPS